MFRKTLDKNPGKRLVKNLPNIKLIAPDLY